MSEWASSKTESLFLWRINQCLNTESTLQKRPLPFPTQKISFWFFQMGLWSAPNINGVLNRHLSILATDQAVIRRERGQGKAASHTQKATSFVGTSMNSLFLSNTIVSWPHLHSSYPGYSIQFSVHHQTLLTKLKEKNTSYTPLYSQYPKYFFVELKLTTPDTHQLLFYI